MARAARYGNIQPSEFGGMEYERALELARRVSVMHADDWKARAELDVELTKSIMRASGARF